MPPRRGPSPLDPGREEDKIGTMTDPPINELQAAIWQRVARILLKIEPEAVVQVKPQLVPKVNVMQWIAKIEGPDGRLALGYGRTPDEAIGHAFVIVSSWHGIRAEDVGYFYG